MESAFWPESGVRSSVLCWCVWQKSDLSFSEDVFTFDLVYKRFYKFCTFNAICKGSAAKKLYHGSAQKC
jgi:hypothetical protein